MEEKTLATWLGSQFDPETLELLFEKSNELYEGGSQINRVGKLITSLIYDYLEENDKNPVDTEYYF